MAEVDKGRWWYLMPQELFVRFWRQECLLGKLGDITPNSLNMGKVIQV